MWQILFMKNSYCDTSKGLGLELGAETYLIQAERFRLSSYSRMPKSQTRNQCRNAKLMPKREINAELGNQCRNAKLWNFGISFGFWNRVSTFGISFGFRHQFRVWDFGKLKIIPKLVLTIAESKHISAYINFGTQPYFTPKMID